MARNHAIHRTYGRCRRHRVCVVCGLAVWRSADWRSCVWEFPVGLDHNTPRNYHGKHFMEFPWKTFSMVISHMKTEWIHHGISRGMPHGITTEHDDVFHGNSMEYMRPPKCSIAHRFRASENSRSWRHANRKFTA